jgi:hypothetical protein
VCQTSLRIFTYFRLRGKPFKSVAADALTVFAEFLHLIQAGHHLGRTGSVYLIGRQSPKHGKRGFLAIGQSCCVVHSLRHVLKVRLDNEKLLNPSTAAALR